MGSSDQADTPSPQVLKAIQEDQRTLVGKLQRDVVIMGVVLVAAIWYMSWVWVSISPKLTPKQVTLIAGARIEERIPLFRDKLKQRILDDAPRLADQAKKLLVESPPKLRAMLEARLTKQGNEFVAKMETEMDAMLAATFAKQVAQLEQAAKSGTSPEEEILKVSKTDYVAQTKAKIDSMHGEYAAQVKKVIAFFEELHKGEGLSPRDQIARELVEVWITLVHKEGMNTLGGGSAKPPGGGGGK